MSSRFSLLLLLAATGFGVLLHREQQRGTFESFDRGHREFLRANPGSAKRTNMTAKPQVILARLDDPDLPMVQRAFDAWPPRPDEWQVVLQNLTDWKPQAITLGMPLAVENPSPGFLKSLSAAPGLTLGVNASAAFSPEFIPPGLPPGLPVLRVEGNPTSIPQFETLEQVALEVRLGIGHVDLGQNITIEGEWCRVPLLARTGTLVVPTLMLQSILTWSTIPPDQLRVKPGTAITGPKGLSIPIDESGCFRFYLPLAQRVASLQADEFLFDKNQAETTYGENTQERKALKSVAGSLVWLGEDDAASRVLKLADGNTASEADLITRALAAIQTGRFIRPLAPLLQSIPQAAAVIFGFWLVRWQRRNLWKGLAVGALFLLTASLLAFQSNHTWIPLAPALLQLGIVFILGWLMPRPAIA